MFSGLQTEMNSADRRRELNRLAAQKLRNRQKEKAVTVKQDYFAAQSRNTQLLYDVKQLRKMKMDLNRQYEAHLPMCRRSITQGDVAQNVNHASSQPVLSGTLPQYAVYTSGQQQFYSPLLLLSSVGSGLASAAPVQFVTVAASDCIDSLDLNLRNANGGIKQESDSANVVTRLSNGDVALQKKHEVLNGVCKPNSVAVAESCSTPGENSVAGVSSVPASPVVKPTYNTRRRRSMTSARRSSEPALSAVKRSTVRHMSSDQPPAKKADTENDSLPSFLSSMTDED